jgi:hypothetical protein
MASGQPITSFKLTSGDPNQSQAEARLNEQVIESYLARIEQTLEARLDDLVEERLRDLPAPASPAHEYTKRIAASLGVGIPLTLAAGAIAGGAGPGYSAIGAVIAVLALIFGLNVFYTTAELVARAVERERRHRRP